MRRINDKLISWASILDDGTLQQAITTSELEIIEPHVALMADAHFGMGATVGSVIPTQGAVIPAAVGVDIGCGMIAVQTQFQRRDLPKDRATVREAIEKAIPLSAGRYNKKITPSAQLRITELEDRAIQAGFTPEAYSPNWRKQLGSLGSGNHFIEICLDEDDRVWTFLHSGSRGVGNRIAQHHIRVAKDNMEAQGIQLAERDLAWLNEGTEDFDRYIQELLWAQHFALLNREEMMDRVNEELGNWVGEPVQEQRRINAHHNFTEQETHCGITMWVTRKGAIRARSGEWAAIPGSMGTASYIVTGKGNDESFHSAPHGAGRQYSRRAAKRKFTQQDLRDAMGDIEYRDDPAFIDEIPQAYKPIDQVMEDSKDLVEIRHTLRQIVNVKGD